MKKEEKEFDLQKRAYKWSLDVITLTQELPQVNISKIITSQLLRSSTSVVANITEGKSGLSRKDFAKCFGIALKECNESQLWLNYVIDIPLLPSVKMTPHLEEAQEIAKILAAIIIKTKKNT